MTENGFESIITERVRGMGVRLAQATLAAIIAWLLHPSAWPVLWAGAYLVAQLIDRHLFAAARNRPESERQAGLIVSIICNVLIFSSLSVYNWLFGGNEGKVFAAVTICCSLISVTLSLYFKKRYLYAAVVPHALYLVSLPVISLAIEHHGDWPQRWPMAIVTVSVITFVLYIMVAVRKLNATLNAAEKARDEAMSANAAKSNFLAVITHEIRTPMNAVVSSLNFLRRTPLNEEQKAHLNMLEGASDVLMGLLNDVLDLSRIEAGKMSFERAPVDVREIMHGLRNLFAAQAREKGLTLEAEVAADLPRQVMADPLRLRQILFNLVSNAVKFTEHGTVMLRVTAEGGQVAFTVEDSGIGIAPDAIERIFLSFEQAEAATTRRYGGTGLGLAISRRLARLMGGDITVASTPGEGARFTLTLPCEAAEPAPAPAAEEVVPDAPLHVLIVDDHEVNRRIVSLFIQPLGWAWTMAENGVEAVRLAREQAFDVILMDMQMPVMDGITATRHIREGDGPNRHTPVVALTANALEPHLAAWAAAGVHTVLAKPFDPEQLVTTMASHAAQGWQVGVDEDEAVSA